MNINTRSVKCALLVTGVPALLLTIAGLGIVAMMPPSLSPVPSVRAAESGHEGGCSDCGGESGGTHGSGEHDAGGTHGGHAGGEKGYGRGGPGGHAEGGHDIGDTIFRGQGRRGGNTSHSAKKSRTARVGLAAGANRIPAAPSPEDPIGGAFTAISG